MWAYILTFYCYICKMYMNNVNIVTNNDGSLVLLFKAHNIHNNIYLHYFSVTIHFSIDHTLH